MNAFRRPEHQVIAEALSLMRADFLLQNHCWFGGGTAIVLRHGEYRLSADVDFLCADQVGYRAMREAAVKDGIMAFFAEPARQVREMRTDQYGIRTVLELSGQPIKFEIVREARIEIYGSLDPKIGVPVLDTDDMFAEKLLANADRCMDRSVACRDAIDIGMLLVACGEIPFAALSKAETAYGHDIRRKLIWSAERLQNRQERLHCAQVLQMDETDLKIAVSHLSAECTRLWPDLLKAKP